MPLPHQRALARQASFGLNLPSPSRPGDTFFGTAQECRLLVGWDGRAGAGQIRAGFAPSNERILARRSRLGFGHVGRRHWQLRGGFRVREA
jgi:hypothetical protein